MSYISGFKDYLVHEKRYSEHTVLAYEKDLQQFMQIADLISEDDLADVNHMLVRSFIVGLSEKGLENSSINRKLSTIKTFYRFMRQQGHIKSNPTSKVRSLKQKKVLPQFVPESQLWTKETFEEEEDDFKRIQAELILELFYQTGIRLSELIGLKDANVSGSKIKVLGKRNKERIIPISNKLSLLVREYQTVKAVEGLHSTELLCDKKGKKLSPKFVYSCVNHYLGKTTNLSKKSPHVLRHTFATHMLNNGASLEVIKKLLGHADLSATQIYTHNSFKQVMQIYNQAHPRGSN